MSAAVPVSAHAAGSARLTEALADGLATLEVHTRLAERLARAGTQEDAAVATRAVCAAAEEALRGSRLLLRALPHAAPSYRPQPGLGDLAREAGDRVRVPTAIDPRAVAAGRQLVLYRAARALLDAAGPGVALVLTGGEGGALTLTATVPARAVPPRARRAVLAATVLRAGLYGGTAEWESARRFALRLPPPSAEALRP